MRASSGLKISVLREVWRHVRDREHYREEPSCVLSGGYAPDLAKAEGSSILDEPGESRTPVRENQRREPGGF